MALFQYLFYQTRYKYNRELCRNLYKLHNLYLVSRSGCMNIFQSFYYFDLYIWGRLVYSYFLVFLVLVI